MNSRKHYTPAILFALMGLAFVVSVALSAPLLPDKLATHFNVGGSPDGWMPRAAYVPFVCFFGVGMSLLVIGVTFLTTRFLPDWMINLPHKEYWLSPQERPKTNAYLLGHSLWLGCMILFMFGAAHFLTIVANKRTPVRLPETEFGITLGLFLAGVVVWTILLFRRFRKPPAMA